MQIAFLIPSTSKNRDWENIHETYLFKILLPSLSKMESNIKETLAEYGMGLVRLLLSKDTNISLFVVMILKLRIVIGYIDL